MLSLSSQFRYISDSNANTQTLPTSSSAPNEALKLEEGESIDIQSGGMLAFQNLHLETHLSNRTLWQRIKNFFFGSENIFTNTFTGLKNGGWLLLKEDFHHQIVEFTLSQKHPNIIVVNKAYMASSPNVELDTSFGGTKSWFRGTGLFPAEARLKAHKADEIGKIYLRSDWGPIRAIKIEPGVLTTIDNDALVGYTSGLDCSVGMLGNAVKSYLFSKEALVCTFSGSGYVFTRNHPKKWLCLHMESPKKIYRRPY